MSETAVPEVSLLHSVITPIVKKESKHDITMKGKLYSFKMEPCCKGGITLTYTTLQEVNHPLGMILGQTKNEKIEIPAIARMVHAKWYDPYLGISMKWRCKRALKSMKKAFVNTEIQEKITNQIREEFEHGV